MVIEYRSKLSDEEKKIINCEFENHASKYGLRCNYKPFNFVAIENNEMVGFLVGYCVFDSVYIDELIVVERCRKKGIGRELIKKVEDCYIDKQHRYIELVTNGFQALDFYKKCGFEIEFTRENIDNPKLNKIFLIKYF